jgi:glycosyltransferase involved in cell wall biosynthesis
LSDLIVITKFVDSSNLPAIYQNADVFVTASIFEGFGFTPLESMAAGTPVAASNCTSLPEVVADAAILFDPYDENDIAEKLHRLLTNRNLNNELIQKGFENIKRFNWNDCCKQTVGVYENMLKAI